MDTTASATTKHKNGMGYYIITAGFALLCAFIVIFQRNDAVPSILNIGNYQISTTDFFIIMSAGLCGYRYGLLSFALVFTAELLGINHHGYASLFSLFIYLFTAVLQGYMTHKGWYKGIRRTIIAALVFTVFLGSSWYMMAFYIFREGFDRYQSMTLVGQYIGAMPEVVLSQALLYIIFNYLPDKWKVWVGEGYKYTADYRACMKENDMKDGSVLGGHVSLLVMSEAVILGICAAVFCSFQTKAIMPEAQLDTAQILIVSVQMFMLIMCIAIPVAIGINELILKIVVRPINRMTAVMRRYFGADGEKRRASVEELEKLNINSRNEIGNLYCDLRCMVTEMSDYIDTLQKKQELEEAIEQQTEKTAHLTREFMVALASTVDAKDHYTSGHSMRVAEYSREIAKRLGKSEQEQENIFVMGLLHDIGKIGVSELIINKTSRLTDEEYAEIKKHPVIGYDILKNVSDLPGLATGARWHHERFDGRGYPDGLAGEDIPEEARIIGVADAYDAMTSKRAYSSVRPQSEVRTEIIRCKGTQFDPVFADIMVSMIDADTNYDMCEK